LGRIVSLMRQSVIHRFRSEDMTIDERHRLNADQPADTGVKSGLVLVLHADMHWRCDSHREMYDRIIHELGYEPTDVYEVRITATAIEVDFVDFEDQNWPVITRRHVATTGSPLTWSRQRPR